MKRNAYRVLVGAGALIVAAPLLAQQTYPTPATTAPTPPPPPPAAATQPGPANPAPSAQQASDRGPPAAKQKICEATVIRAGPNQGQVINKCRRSDK